MLKIHANAAQMNAIKGAAAFLVVVRNDTGYGVAPGDLKVVPAAKINTLPAVPTARLWVSREGVVAPDAKKFCKGLAKLGVEARPTFVGDISRYGGGLLRARAIKIHPVKKDGSVGEGITLVRIGGELYAPVHANRWVKDYAIAHGGNIHKRW